MTIEKSLADYNPELSKSWHPNKNGILLPHQVALYSNKRVWWKCEKGHEWQAIISNRTGKNKTGCPYCSGKKTRSDNNFAVLFPELLKEWNHQKNLSFNPERISPNSHRKVWWFCSKGHEWQTAVVYRTRQHSGCPYCSGRLVCTDNCLRTLFPELSKEWHPTKNGGLTPEDVTSGTDRKVWWECSKGHEWEAAVCHRAGKNKTGCPSCFGRKATDSNNLSLKSPELLKEWNYEKNNPLKPDELKSGSNKKVWWKCFRGHEWITSPNKRTGKDATGCPYCTQQTSRIEIRIFCELKYLFSDIEWRRKIDGIEVDIFFPKYLIGIEVDGYPWHSNKEENDKIKCVELLKRGVKLFRLRDYKLKRIDKTDVFFNHNEDDLPIIHRLFLGLINNVPFDLQDKDRIMKYIETSSTQNDKEYQRILSFLPSPPPEYSLASVHKHLISEWHFEKNAPLTPENFAPSAGVNVWWECAKGPVYQSYIYNRIKGVGCPYCAGKKVSDDNNLAFMNPALIKEWHPKKNNLLTPDQVYAGTTKKVWWRCAKGHEWEVAPRVRMRGEGCPYCSGRRVSAENNLLALFPAIAKEWHFEKNKPLNPEDVTARSDKKVWWKCAKGHEWESTVANRSGIQKSGCPYCAGQKVSTDNNLLSLFPKIAKEWHFENNSPLKPEDYTAHSNKKVWWRCTNNHEWEAFINNRTGKNKTGCPYCAGQKVSLDNNLAVVYPKIAHQWNFEKNMRLRPENVTSKSGKRVWWRCLKGHEWEAVIANRTVNNNQCPDCSDRKKSHL